MSCNSGSLGSILRLLSRLYTLNPATLPRPCSFGGMNEPFDYMHIYGLYLRGWLVYNVLDKGGGLLVVVILEAFPFLVYFILYLEGVSYMGFIVTCIM